MREIRRRRILVLTPRDPYVGIGGDRLRIHRMARELAKHHDLTLLTLCRSKTEQQAPIACDGVFRQIHRIVLPTWKRFFNTLGAIPTAEPLQIAYYRSPEFQEAVDLLAPHHDMILAHLVRTATYVPGGAAGVRVLEMTDAISMSMERVTQSKADYFDPRQLLYRIEAKRLAAYERRLAARFDLVSLTSAIDLDYLTKSPSSSLSHALVIPNGSDMSSGTPVRMSRRAEAEIVFVGNLGSLQNFDAAWFFAKKVLPGVRQRFPNAVLRIVGPIGAIARRRLASIKGVRIEGIVPDLHQALATARIGVCPVRTGAGIKNKVLDYFANGLAVVCSPTALGGIAAKHGEHLMLAESIQEWVASVTKLLSQPMEAQRLADAGHTLVREQYRWDQCVQPLLARMNKLMTLSESESLRKAAALAAAAA